MKNLNNKTFKIIASVSAFTLTVIFLPVKVDAVSNIATEKCAFSRDLDLDTEGDDVKCLQKFLNSSGFVITQSGAGSPGRETGQLKSLTQQAIINWQKSNGIFPATGYFGTKSRQKYSDILKTQSIASVNGTGSKVTAVNTGGKSIETLNKELADLLKQAEVAKERSNTNTNPTAIPSNLSSSEKDVRQAIQQAIKDLDDAKAQIKRAKSSGKDVTKATTEMSDAREDFVSAVGSYLSNDFAKAIVRARDSSHNALDALESAGGVSKESKADNLISDVEDNIDEAEDKIHDADRKGEDVDEAEKLLDKAKSIIEQAKKYFDDNKFSDAETQAEKADDIVSDAIDAIGNDSKDRADEAISDAQDLIDDVRDLIRKAKNRGESTTSAERLYEKARTSISNAQDQFDEKEYADALESARDAKSFANDAKDEL